MTIRKGEIIEYALTNSTAIPPKRGTLIVTGFERNDIFNTYNMNFEYLIEQEGSEEQAGESSVTVEEEKPPQKITWGWYNEEWTLTG